MASLTDDEFEAALAEDLGWRKIELAALKRVLDDAARSSSDSPASRAFSRALVAMCYAHWEGYSKNCLEKYARLVSRRKPLLSDAGPGLALEHAARLFRRISSGDDSARESLLRSLRGGGDERLNVDRTVLADTKANLRFATLQDLFRRGCIPIDRFELRANLIDVHLCDRRNDVAHGRALIVAPVDALDLVADVIALMDNMQDVLVVQVRTKGYLNPVVEGAP